MADQNQIEDGARGTLETIGMTLSAMRNLLTIVNGLVIFFSLYFLISGKNLGWEPLQMAIWIRIILSLIVIILAIYGIMAAVWWGKKSKLQLKMLTAYLIGIIVVTVVAIILSAIYVRHPTKWDIIFIVLACLATIILITSTLSFSYGLKKTRLLRRFNLFSL